ncbi:Lipid A 3-O-deacylase (PagL) [Roseovarius litorisediminis]|uniref:Lipid A 3-O-deacylase (PagL) n=1 Tax=Roseovarius litorisediminis TaxID=1312363 RepID=A0A1Y5RVF5_9RHOB|nr:Lipid A 3-O-deacylase (PagL) [Roseovarius litorisediminis]
MSDLAFITDGTFAVIGLVAGLIDMGINHCPNDGCLTKNKVQSYASLSVGDTVFQKDTVGEEIYFRRDTSIANGPFQLAYGLSASSDGELWAGIGHVYTLSNRKKNMFLQLHAMTGLYEEGDGVDLGGPIEFRSGIEFGYQNKSGVRMSVGADHRSNAGLYSGNPGLETVHFRVSIPTK